MTIGQQEWKQDFFTQAPSIKLSDPLASVLGAVDEGAPIEYRFEDCVKVAGHACASVASAFMMTRLALKELYKDALPVRGGVKVRFAGERTSGANGPIGQVIQFLTGAATETGFHGLGGKYGRDNLFDYDPEFASPPGVISAEFMRTDTGEKVTVMAEPSKVPLSQEEVEGAQMMPKVIQGTATEDERESFFTFWQGRNRKILLEDHEGVFTVSRVE